MNNPFAVDKYDELLFAAKKWHSDLNLFGAGAIAFALPYAESLLKQEVSFFSFLSLLISFYLMAIALGRGFPDLVFEINKTGTPEQKKFMRNSIFGGFKSHLKCSVYWLGSLLIMACLLATAILFVK